MTKKKFNKFLDFVTVLVILFPLLMCLITARSTGTFDHVAICDYVNQFVISTELAEVVQASMTTLGFDLNGSFAFTSCVIMANALLIWVFRVFISVMTFIPKFAIRMVNLSIGDSDT